MYEPSRDSTKVRILPHSNNNSNNNSYRAYNLMNIVQLLLLGLTFESLCR